MELNEREKQENLLTMPDISMVCQVFHAIRIARRRCGPVDTGTHMSETIEFVSMERLGKTPVV